MDPAELSRLPPFAQLKSVQRLASHRSGHASTEHVRHQLYTAHDPRTRTPVLVKLTSKPGLVYQQDLSNEIDSLATINRELPTSSYFPELRDHGRLRDGRVYLIMTLFNELPLATTIGPEPLPARTVGYLRTTLEVARALSELHSLPLFHVDLNPMNILYRSEKGRPVIRIVDFESSYEPARHAHGTFYSPPTTSGFTAPEVTARAPDARSDLYSLGAVLYTMLGGYEWTWKSDARSAIEADGDVDGEIRKILLSAVDPDPNRRYPSIQEMHAAVAAYLEAIWPGRSW